LSYERVRKSSIIFKNEENASD